MRNTPMSSATSSHQTPLNPEESSIVEDCIDRLTYGVRATAFWTAAVLPIAVFAALIAGAAGQYPLVLAGVLALNVVCAVVGHAHAQGEQ